MNPTFGDAVLWALVFTYAILVLTPIVLWFRLPKRKSPPALTEGPEYETFMGDFKRRLSRNVRLRGVPLGNAIEVEDALQKLDRDADEVVTSTASAVFLSTALLQGGRLDELVVLVAQTKLIWQVAHVYYQRPSLRDFAQLYANVASTTFIAAGIEDMDVDVLLGTVFGSTVAAIPGMHLLASSILSGSANAFLATAGLPRTNVSSVSRSVGSNKHFVGEEHRSRGEVSGVLGDGKQKNESRESLGAVRSGCSGRGDDLAISSPEAFSSSAPISSKPPSPQDTQLSSRMTGTTLSS